MKLTLTKLFYFGAVATATVIPREDNLDWDVTNHEGWSQPVHGDGCGEVGCQFRVYVGGDKVEYGNWDPVAAWSWALDSKCDEYHCDTTPFVINDMVTRYKDFWDFYEYRDCSITLESDHIDSKFILEQLRNVMRAALEKTKEQWNQKLSKMVQWNLAGQMAPPANNPEEDYTLYNGPSQIQVEFKGGENYNSGTITGRIEIGSKNDGALCDLFDGITSIMGLMPSPWAAVPGVAVGLLCKATL